MIRSMTGFGSASYEGPEAKVSIDVRSVNGRYLDINIRLPKELQHLEAALRTAIRALVSRGRIDVTATLQAASSSQYRLNEKLAAQYAQIASQLRDSLSQTSELNLGTLLQLPGVIEVHSPSLGGEDEVAAGVGDAFRRALESLNRMREQEGQNLVNELRGRVEAIGERLLEIARSAGDVKEAYHQKLRLRLLQALDQANIDESRVLQEVLMYVERSDISEELTRMESHLGQMRKLLESDGEVGKKLDFLLQEMNREINTTLAKAANAAASEVGIWIKNELEKVREQVQNLE